MIEGAAALGDMLVVIVNNNAQQVIKKGKIIQDEADRLASRKGSSPGR